MARKDRVPDPPKRPQGPQRRAAVRTPDESARRRRTLLLAGAGAVAALAVVLGFVFIAGGGSNDGGRAALEEAGCTLEVKPAQEGQHTVELTETANDDWNTDPPTSGPHHPQPAVYGFYEDEVPFPQSIHNLEHGAIVVHYGDEVPDDVVEQIRAWYTDDPNGVLVARYDKLGAQIALSAWTTDEALTGDEADNGEGYLAKCDGFDEDAFSDFRDSHRFEGPERFPEDALHPGNS